ncbi:MAG TPA: dihydrodipicolinate synthase family protein [Candidatus Dormibacteraeota bacterium]|nr:dihydrodipicolinate synthase family protein [Candidatus Dormibacteraeota bacterium]
MKYTKGEAKDYAKERLRGIFSAFCVPETPDGEIDEAGLRHDIRHYRDVIKADGLYVHGFYGNFWLLSTAERKRVMEIVADENRGQLPIVCRCAHQSLKETIDLIHHAEANGADFISLIGPSFGQASESMIYEYFERVASETNLGLSIFNTAQAGYVISPELMARLARIPNVCALKNAVAMSHTIKVRELVGDSIVVIDPSEEHFLINMLEFGQRAIYTGTNYMYDSAWATPMRDYVQAGLAGETRRAVELYYRMQPLRDLHHRWVREPWDRQGLCPVATIKFWTEQLGLTGGRARPPLPQLPEERRAALRAEMEEVGLIPARQASKV